MIDRGIAERVAIGCVALLLIITEHTWLATDFPLEPAVLASIADQAVARLNRDQR